MRDVKISSTGSYLPPTVQTAAELAPVLGRTEEWISRRAGVAQRRVATEAMEVMAARAARQALGDGRAPDCVINASTTPVQLIPDSSASIQRELGFVGVPSWSVHATCLSFLVAMVNAAALVGTGAYDKILVVSSETATQFRNPADPDSAALLGDGAAAAVLEPAGPDEPSRIIDWQLGTWPEGADLTEVRGYGTRRPPGSATEADNLFRMDGPGVVRLAQPLIAEMLTGLLDKNGLSIDDIDWVVPHQASSVAFALLRRLGFRSERVVRTLDAYGNTAAASIPMALAHADQRGMLSRGDRLLLGGTGAGLSIGFALLTW